jgi:hypothetical protein
VCETWSLALREKNRFSVFEYRTLRRLALEEWTLTGSWRKLHKEELHKLCMVMRWRKVRRQRHTHMWMGWEMHTKFWSENFKGNSTLKTRCGWKDNIKTDLEEIRFTILDYIHLTPERVLKVAWTRYWPFGFQKILGLVEQLLAPQEGLHSTEPNLS